jgi:hypothetical protein
VFCPGTLGPYCGGPDPIRGGGPDPIPGVRSVHVGVLDQTWRSGLYIQGSDTFPWGPNSLLMSWSTSLSLDTWQPRTRLCGGVRRCWPRVVAQGWGKLWPGPTYSSFTTRLKIAKWVLRLYTVVRGTLVSGYRHCPFPSKFIIQFYSNLWLYLLEFLMCFFSLRAGT